MSRSKRTKHRSRSQYDAVFNVVVAPAKLPVAFASTGCQILSSSNLPGLTMKKAMQVLQMYFSETTVVCGRPDQVANAFETSLSSETRAESIA